MGLESLIQRLGNREVILPYLETAFLDDRWPMSYTVEIDSSPYYGKGDGYFHPSSHPLLSERVLYYMFHPDFRDKIIPERNTLQRQMTLSMGSGLHGVIQTQLIMAGLVDDTTQLEVEFVNHEHHVRGRVDWITHHPSGELILAELKTLNSFGFNTLKEPKESWINQTNLGMDNLGFDYAILVVLESGFPYRMREMRIEKDQSLIDNIYAKFDRVREAIEKNEPPRPCCPMGSAQMKQCPARNACPLGIHFLSK